MHTGTKILFFSILFLLTGINHPMQVAISNDRVKVIQSDGGIVVSDSTVASQIGRDVLLDGGNAVDAAVATAFALAVSWPEAGNIGGGGFMLIRPANGENPVCIDYRETAPLSMHKDAFKRSDTTFTQKAVGVPGTVRGLALAHAEYGLLEWSRLVMPASELALKGVPVDQPLARSLNSILNNSSVKSNAKYSELLRVYGKRDKTSWQAGDKLVLPDLGATLKLIAEEGPNSFYTGIIAKQLTDEMERGDGEISLKDLEQYQAVLRPAMKGKFRDYTVLGAPPPSSGGTCIIEALNIIENFNMKLWDRYDPQCVHLIAETCKRVFADRARYLGDPAFTRIPEFLTSKEYARKVAKTIDLEKATPSEAITPEINVVKESPDTTHFSIIDENGMAVSNTYTLEATWGSRIVVKGAGFLLNNEMGDFNWFPGETNEAGRIGTKPNTIAPGKRMLSSQSPTMLAKNGKVVLITGSPGGRTIINTVLGIVLGVAEFDLAPVQAVAGARMHHQWFPDQLDLEDLENPPHSRIRSQLSNMGHTLGNRPKQGSAHTIAIDVESGERTGIADQRRSGGPAEHSRGTLARWDFDDPENTKLTETDFHGPNTEQWTNELPSSTCDGAGCLNISKSHLDDVIDTYLPLKDSAATVALEIEIRELRLAGTRLKEKIQIGFTSDRDRPKVSAQLVLARTPSGDISIHGEGPGRGTSIPPAILLRHRDLGDAVALRLEIDQSLETYRILFRKADEPEFHRLGSGKIAPSRPAKYLRLCFKGDFSDNEEAVKVDSLTVTLKRNE